MKNKVLEANCEIVCVQEIKKEGFDSAFLRKILPPSFDDLLYVPSVGASGGILVAWKSQFFSGNFLSSNGFSLAVQFTSKIDESTFTMINVYGPCVHDGKVEFTNWLKNLQILDDEDWIILGDFNLYRHPENRNRQGADINEMFLFNNAISRLGQSEILLQGKKFTWSNMQQPHC